MDTIKNYPEIRYDGDVVYVPHYLADQIPNSLLKEWRSKGYTIQLEIT